MATPELSDLEQRVLGLIVQAEVVSFLQALIRQRSDHPPGDCRRAIEVAAQKLSEAGVGFEVKTQTELQPSLLATLSGVGGESPRLMYHAHIDTVPAGELALWSTDPFGGEIKDGRIYGRGAGDDKGSVAAQIIALVTLARTGVSLNGCLQVAVVADEESGGLVGTKWLHDEGVLAPDYLVVGEQTNNRVAVGERVACGIDLTVFGQSAHGAMPWAGENAVLKAARALTWLQDKLFPKLQAKAVPFLPPPTLNVGKIQGGIQWSIVPERCKVEMDRRLIPGETRDIALAELRELLDEYSETVEPLRYELFSTGEMAPNINTPPNEPFVVTANEALEAVCGEKRDLTGYVQTSDGRWFAGDGIPIIIFGPSDPAVAHATDEHISIEQLIEATQFLTLFALRWLNN